jgi:hypothetical protein
MGMRAIGSPPPSGGDKHSPSDGCGWGVFVTYLMSGKFKETKCLHKKIIIP